MKGFNALALSQLINTAEQQHRLTRPLSVLLTYDEEIGCFGVRDFLAAHKKEFGTPDLILVGEPTELKPVLAHKGCHCYEVNIWGKNAHSSNPNKGVNAVEYASIAISRLLELNRVTDLNDLRRRDDPESEAYRILDDRFDPPHSTINIGTIKGGEAINITAHHCRFTFETRPIPDDDGTIVGRDLDDILNSREFYTHGDNGYDHEGFEFEVSEYISNPPFEGDPEAPGTKFLLKHLDDPTPLAVPFMTEASALSNAGFNTVVCGPGSIEQAHQLNEFITRDQLERGAKLLERLTERCFEPA